MQYIGLPVPSSSEIRIKSDTLNLWAGLHFLQAGEQGYNAKEHIYLQIARHI